MSTFHAASHNLVLRVRVGDLVGRASIPHPRVEGLLRSQTFKYNASVKRGGPTGRNYIEEEEEEGH